MIGRLFFSFNGRIGRGEYWKANLMLGAGAALVFLVFGVAFGEVAMWVAYGVYLLAILGPSLALAVKRLHDRGKSGWLILIQLIPIVGSIWLLVQCYCLSGEEGPNRYGPEPV